MGLETIIKIMLGGFLFSIFGSYINTFVYYVFYAVRFGFSASVFVFKFLGISSLGIGLIYTIFFFAPLLFLLYIVKSFLYK